MAQRSTLYAYKISLIQNKLENRIDRVHYFRLHTTGLHPRWVSWHILQCQDHKLLNSRAISDAGPGVACVRKSPVSCETRLQTKFNNTLCPSVKCQAFYPLSPATSRRSALVTRVSELDITIHSTALSFLCRKLNATVSMWGKMGRTCSDHKIVEQSGDLPKCPRGMSHGLGYCPFTSSGYVRRLNRVPGA